MSVHIKIKPGSLPKAEPAPRSPDRAQRRQQEADDVTAMRLALDRFLALPLIVRGEHPDRIDMTIRMLQVRHAAPAAFDWQKLAASADSDLAHDVLGMMIERRSFGGSGKLHPSYSPRFLRT